jgi:hypothetical protein
MLAKKKGAGSAEISATNLNARWGGRQIKSRPHMTLPLPKAAASGRKALLVISDSVGINGQY